jgi:nucleoside-diphosphate-sugar epimerase
LGLRVEEYSPEAIPRLPKGAVIIHTIPPLPGEERENVRAFICKMEPRRVLYISSTSVYGDQTTVTAETGVCPSEPKGQSRVDEENWLKSQPWTTLIVRPAAIYGPGRGVHLRILEGKGQRSTASVVSRIHADDLAAILEAGVDSKLEGAFPCADEHPCSSDEIVQWCSRLLKITALPAKAGVPVAGRSVDGRKIRELLGIRLLYPDYMSGVLASVPGETVIFSELLTLRG